MATQKTKPNEDQPDGLTPPVISETSAPSTNDLTDNTPLLEANPEVPTIEGRDWKGVAIIYFCPICGEGQSRDIDDTILHTVKRHYPENQREYVLEQLLKQKEG